MMHAQTDVLIVGAGAAGMYAAIAASKAGADTLLLDKSFVGRGGATIMAQMTVAAALNENGDDDWTRHFEDTLKAGRGLCDEELAAILCEHAPERIRELDEWKVGWARDEGGKIVGVQAPGHSVPRCVYVDFLNTGPALARTLRTRVSRTKEIRRASGVSVREIVVREGRAVGDLAARLGVRLALLAGQQTGQIITVRKDKLEPTPQNARAI